MAYPFSLLGSSIITWYNQSLRIWRTRCWNVVTWHRLPARSPCCGNAKVTGPLNFVGKYTYPYSPPCFFSNAATSECPRRSARANGLDHAAPALFGSASFARKWETNSMLPRQAAILKGVDISASSTALISAPNSSRRSRI